MRNPRLPIGGESAELIPRRLIFGNPERQIVRISPDGTRIALLAPVDGVLNLWVAPIEAIDQGRPVTAVTDRNLGPSIFWMHDGRHILFFREQGGDENSPATKAKMSAATGVPPSRPRRQTLMRPVTVWCARPYYCCGPRSRSSDSASVSTSTGVSAWTHPFSSLKRDAST
jgi:hypothetical protein